MGYLGSNLFRPIKKGQAYRLIYKFDCIEHFRLWEKSETRTQYYAKIRPLLVEPPHMYVLTGLETWFELPEQGVVTSPPRYKMAIISWLAIYPLVFLVLEFLNPILDKLPIFARAAMITLIVIPSMIYILMPFMTKFFAKW